MYYYVKWYSYRIIQMGSHLAMQVKHPSETPHTDSSVFYSQWFICGLLFYRDKDYKIPLGQKGKWIKYAITKEYPGGIPWEDQEEKKKKKQGSNSSRLAFIFHVHSPEEQRLAILLNCTKYLNLWHEPWGGVAFMVEQLGFTTPAGVKDRYIEIVQSHGAMQLSMGAATILGIVTATRKFTLCLTPDKNRTTTGTN
jgi:hypothetical protein